MSEQSLWYLENIDIMNIFCPEKVDHALDHMRSTTFTKGAYIYLPDEDADKVYFLTEGCVRLGVHGDNGKEITKAILTKGEVFGELALMHEGKRRDFAFAMEDSSACILTVDEMRKLMREHSSLNLFLMKLMGSRVLEMENRLESLVFKDSRSRIIELVLEYAKKRGLHNRNELRVLNFIRHKDIANLTATSRQTVTSVLNELRNKELISFDRKMLIIHDAKKLEEESSPQIDTD
jgi:CRP-like cAMP-binding protein